MANYKMFTVRIMLNQALNILNKLMSFAIDQSEPANDSPPPPFLFLVELNEITGCYVVSGKNRRAIIDPRNSDVAGSIRYELEEMIVNESIVSDNYFKMRD